MEATEHSRFVGITIEWKDAANPGGEKTSPEGLQICVTAPFEQVWDMHNVLNGLPFSKSKPTTTQKRRGSMMVQRKHRDSPSVKPRGPRIKIDDGANASPAISAIPALKMDSASLASDNNKGPSPPLSPTKGSETHAIDAAIPAATSENPESLVKAASPPNSPKSEKSPHEHRGSRALSPRDLVSEINLSKDEYFNWTLPLEPNLRLEPVLAVLTTKLCAYMGNYNYDLVTMTAPQNTRTYLFKLSFG